MGTPQEQESQKPTPPGIDDVEKRRARIDLIERIRAKTSDHDFWEAIRGYYEIALPLIEAAPRWKWAVEFYELDWVEHFSHIEGLLWRESRSQGVVLYPQFPIGRYFVDFANPVAGLVIECDGALYHQDPERDLAREREIRRLGWVIWRITGRECMSTRELEDEHGRPRPNRDELNQLLHDAAKYFYIAPWSRHSEFTARRERDENDDEIPDEFLDG